MTAKSPFPSPKLISNGRIFTWIAIVMIFGSPVFAAELLRNGSFSNDLTGWKVSATLNDWNPLQGGAVNLHPPGFGYKGLLLYQNVNVSGVAGQTLTLSLQLQKQYAPSGNTLDFSVDYMTTNGVIKRLKVLTPRNDDLPAMVYTNVTTNFTLPAEAMKLVRLVISKEANGDFLADDFSLTATALVPGAVPQIISVSPAYGSYSSGTNNSLLTVRGQNFGAVTGQVWLASAPVQAVDAVVPNVTMQIVSWTSTQVVARVLEPLRSGKVNLLAGGVESDGNFNFTLTSPTFTVDAVTSDITAIRGDTVDVVFRVNFLNGFQSTNGISLIMVEPFGVGISTDLPLKQSGGWSFRLNTASLTNGVYQGMVQTLEDNSYARFASFKLKVVGITNINFFEYDTNYQKVSISSKTLTNQGQVYIAYELVNHEGNIFESGGFYSTTPPVTVVSSDPMKLFIFNNNWGQSFFTAANGNLNVTLSTPDGFSKSLPVQVNFPAAPQVTNTVMFPQTTDNSGTITNTLYFQATEPLGWIGYEGLLGINFDGLVRDYLNNAASWTFTVPAGTTPGQYLLHAETTSGAAKRYVPLTVENVSSRGKIAGRFLILENEMFMQGVMGTFELYDASANLVTTNEFEAFGTTVYSIGYVAPGTYRVRFVPDSGYRPQWYPSGSTFADALPVQVQAGQTTSGINFYLRRPGTPPPSLNMPAPVTTAGSFDFTMPTVQDVDYFLESIDSLAGTNWTVTTFLSGDSGVRTLADPNPPGTIRFYRVRMQPR